MREWQERISYSKIDLYRYCPRKAYLKYDQGVRMLSKFIADNPLTIGKALHLGMEQGYAAAEKWYLDQFPLITNEQIEELMKIEWWVDAMTEFFNRWPNYENEVKIELDNAICFIDRVITLDDGSVVLWDYKYSNNIDRYKKSEQLLLYADMYRVKYGRLPDHLGYAFAPKVFIRRQKDENQFDFRKRLDEGLRSKDYEVFTIPFDQQALDKFYKWVLVMQQDNEFKMTEDKEKCKRCEYRKICEGEEDYMAIPKNQRVDRRRYDKMDKWIYGTSYVGKTSFMDQFDNNLMINTDGNIDQVTSPVVRIKDDFIQEGRRTKRVYAWSNFLDLIFELETTHDHGFERITLDLVEDLFEHCRVFVLDKLSIDHESDTDYGKGWTMVRDEFLNAMRRLKNIGLEINYLSKEIKDSVKMKDKSIITTFKPNVNDKVANVLSGLVGATFHLVAESGVRTMSCEMDPYIFGGTRYNFEHKTFALDKETFLKELEHALKAGLQSMNNGNGAESAPEPKQESSRRSRKSRNSVEDPQPEPETEVEEKSAEEEKPVEKEEAAPEPNQEEAAPEPNQEEAAQEPNQEEAAQEPNQEEAAPRRRRRRK